MQSLENPEHYAIWKKCLSKWNEIPAKDDCNTSGKSFIPKGRIFLLWKEVLSKWKKFCSKCNFFHSIVKYNQNLVE